MNSKQRAVRTIIQLLIALLALGLVACGSDGEKGDTGDTGPQGPPGPEGPPGDGGVVDNGTSVEACSGCHDAGMIAPVGDITDILDAHYIDTDPDGPMTASGFRQVNIDITEVDVTGSNVVIEFDVEDEDGAPIDVIFAGDGRFTIAKLLPGVGVGDPTFWQGLIERTEDPGSIGDGPGTPEQQATAERFSTGSGNFENLGGGSYRYTSAHDPSGGSYPVVAGETMRVGIQLSAGDIPPGNGWCDFDADVNNPNDCTSGVSLTRDIVQTATCNTCHSPTSDTQLGIHGGGRTDVEYCVTCHNPGSTDANSGNTVDMTVMIHKIHAGATLENGYKIWGFRDTLHDYSEVGFTKDLDNCQVCHTGGGVNEGNWSNRPNQAACGSCHDTVNFQTGANHPVGQLTTNEFCVNCHPSSGAPAAVQDVHLGVDRIDEAGRYDYVINDAVWDGGSDDLTITYSVEYEGASMDLDNDSEWTAGGGASRLALIVGWEASDYSNEDSGRTPGQPLSINALDIGGVITDNGNGTYTTVVDAGDASGTLTVAIEGHPAADLDGDGTYSDRIPVTNVFQSLAPSGGRDVTMARSDVIDINKCNFCHDPAGQGLSLHGNNRTGEMQVCVICHNPDATDVNRRPADPTTTPDGKAEESIDMKRLIHQIHAGSSLAEGVVVYGFGNSVHDFSDVNFTGNIRNCETCHLPGTYTAEAAGARLGTTIDTGADVGDPSDDLNISPTASVCASCHESEVAETHMLLHGASFHALDEDIH